MAATSNIRAGAAYVELSLKDKRLSKGLAAASKQLKAFGAGLASIGRKIAAFGSAGLASIAAMAVHFKNAGDGLNKMAARTGVSAEALSELGFAAEQSGADLESLEAGLRVMQKNLAAAADGSAAMRDTLRKLGLTIADLKALAPDQQFALLAERLAKVANPARRTALALEVFGKSGQKLIPLLAAGTRGIEELREEARRLGLSVSGEQAQAAADLQDAWNRLVRTVKAAAFAFGAALAGELTRLLGIATRIAIQTGRWIKQNKSLVLNIVQVAAAITVAGAALVALGWTFKLVGAAITGFLTIFAGIGTLLSVLINPVTLVIAALAGLGAYLLYTSDAGTQALAWLGRQFGALRDTALAAWQGISDALAAGDLALAARIAWLALSMEFQRGVLWLEEQWLDFKHFFIDTFHRAVYGVAQILNDAWAGIQVAWVETISFLGDVWTAFISLLQRGWNRFGGFFQKVWARITSVFTGVDAAAEIARINDELAAEEAAISGRRDDAINEREAERRRRRGEIEAERAAVDEELDRMQRGERADRAARRDAALGESAAALEEARREFEAALAEAARRRGPTDPGASTILDRPHLPDLDELESMARQKIDVQGSFNALAARGLGADSANERTARASEQTAANTKKLLQEAQHGGLVFA